MIDPYTEALEYLRAHKSNVVDATSANLIRTNLSPLGMLLKLWRESKENGEPLISDDELYFQALSYIENVDEVLTALLDTPDQDTNNTLLS